MQILYYHDHNFAILLEKALNQSRGSPLDISQSVTEIITQVVSKKDSALINFTAQFDNINFTQDELMVSDCEMLEGNAKISVKQKKALDSAAERIKAFHLKQIPEDKYWIDKVGIEMGWRWLPIAKVGIYVPGGKASYPSSVLMNAVPASVAGVKDIVMVSPSFNGKIDPLVLYAAKISGVDKIYKIGGAQAVAALAYGTETIEPVDKIVGPGNSFVAEAKRQVFGRVGIDMVAGPSEVVIIADGDNRAEWISADLLSQAEHDENAQCVLITTSENLASRVLKSIERQLEGLKRKKIATDSWTKNGVIIVAEDLNQATLISDRFAPEHLQLCVKDPEKLLKSIRNAGSIFIGSWTPEALGDYIIGINHVLPTEKSARFASGLSVLDFMKRSLISKVTQKSISAIGDNAVCLARAEGLGAHELSVALRMADSPKKIIDD